MNLKPDELLGIMQKQEAFLKEAQTMSVKVGLPKKTASIQDEGVSIITIGAAHEYGAEFIHPGGTSYTKGESGRAKFVKKGTSGVVGKTGAHKIVIPQRSFLRVPFAVKQDELVKAIQSQFELGRSGELSVEKALGRIGAVAAGISKKAFTTKGYGTWTDIKPETKKRKKSSVILIDTGTLKQSITWGVERNAS